MTNSQTSMLRSRNSN